MTGNRTLDVEYLTAETEHGRQAIQEVMQRSYTADVDDVLPAWAIARLVDDIPVPFILIAPDKQLELGNSDPYPSRKQGERTGRH